MFSPPPDDRFEVSPLTSLTPLMDGYRFRLVNGGSYHVIEDSDTLVDGGVPLHEVGNGLSWCACGHHRDVPVLLGRRRRNRPPSRARS